MSIMILIASFSILIASGFLVAFIWSVKDGQYDDDFSPPNRILFDDKTIKKSKK